MWCRVPENVNRGPNIPCSAVPRCNSHANKGCSRLAFAYIALDKIVLVIQTVKPASLQNAAGMFRSLFPAFTPPERSSRFRKIVLRHLRAYVHSFKAVYNTLLSLPSCAVHRARVAVVGPVFPGRRQRRLQGQIYAHNYEAFAIAPYFREENEFYSICMASLAPTGSQSRKRVKEGRAAFDALCCFRILCATALTMMRSPESREHIAFSLLLHASARSLFAWFTVVGGARVEGTRSTLRWQHCRTAVGFFTMDD